MATTVFSEKQPPHKTPLKVFLDLQIAFSQFVWETENEHKTGCKYGLGSEIC